MPTKKQEQISEDLARILYLVIGDYLYALENSLGNSIKKLKIRRRITSKLFFINIECKDIDSTSILIRWESSLTYDELAEYFNTKINNTNPIEKRLKKLVTYNILTLEEGNKEKGTFFPLTFQLPRFLLDEREKEACFLRFKEWIIERQKNSENQDYANRILYQLSEEKNLSKPLKKQPSNSGLNGRGNQESAVEISIHLRVSIQHKEQLASKVQTLLETQTNGKVEKIEIKEISQSEHPV